MTANLAMSMKRPTVDASTLSVIVPNYNHGRLIGRAIEALLCQTRVPDEIIIVDDASTDDSLSAIQELAAKWPRITIIRQPVNMGTNAALRKGLDCAKGRYVLLAGADDWILPGFCELGLRMLMAHPEAGLFCGDTVLVDGETGRTIGYRPPARPMYRPGIVSPEACQRLLARMDNFIHTGSTIFRRDAIVAADGLKDDLGAFADGFLTRKIALTSGFCYAPCVVACWCVFRSGLSRTTALDPLKAQDALRLYPAKIASDPAFPDWYADLFRERWRFATTRLALQADAPDFAFIYDMAARSQMDRAVLTLFRAALRGGVMRAAMLGWLWLRLRPYRLTDVAATALLRMFERITRARVGAIQRRVS